MKVLIIHTYYMSRGGEDLVFETESKLLTLKGIHVKSLTFRNSDLKIFNFLSYPFNLLSFFKTALEISRFKPDVIHLHNWHFAASPSVIVACKLLGVPLVQTLHNHRLISSFKTLWDPSGSIKKFGFINQLASLHNLFHNKGYVQSFWIRASAKIFKASQIWKLIDRYIVLTENSLKMYMATHYNCLAKRFVIKSNFIDAGDVTCKAKSDYLLYVGRLTNEKGLNVLLTAIRSCEVKIKIIGDGPLKAEVEKEVERNPNVEYLGFRDFGFIKNIMAQSKAVIFPSITLEGMPMTIIESFACCTPVIASDYSAMHTMITHGYNGLHFEINNPEDLKKQILQLLSMNKDQLESMAQNARKTYDEKYSPEKNIESLISIYTQLKKNKP